MTSRFWVADVDTSNPSGKAVNITPDDNVDLGTTRALYVGGAGDLAVVMADGSAAIFYSFVGGLIPIRVQTVLTQTTATQIVALY